MRHYYLIGRVPVATEEQPSGEVQRTLAFNPLMGGFTTDTYRTLLNHGEAERLKPTDQQTFEQTVQTLAEAYGLPVPTIPWECLTNPVPPAPPSAPTLRRLAAQHFSGNEQALIRLLDDLTVSTLRQARIERQAHHRAVP